MHDLRKVFMILTEKKFFDHIYPLTFYLEEIFCAHFSIYDCIIQLCTSHENTRNRI